LQVGAKRCPGNGTDSHADVGKQNDRGWPFHHSDHQAAEKPTYGSGDRLFQASADERDDHSEGRKLGNPHQHPDDGPGESSAHHPDTRPNEGTEGCPDD
jgi:hypothetical protein